MAADLYAEFAELQKKYPRNIGNDFMLPVDIQDRFMSGTLSFTADDKALFVFERREGFYKLHFRLIDTTAVIPRHDGPLAAYLAYRRGRYPYEAADWLRSQGFTYAKTLLRHSAKVIVGELSDEKLEKASVDEVYSMIGEYFSEVEADLPPREFFWPSGVYCRRARDGSMLGLVYDISQTRIVAVSSAARGQGIGRRLYRAYSEEKARENKSGIFHEWISPDNAASLKMFSSLGFVPDTAMSDCFVLRKSEGRNCEKNNSDTE